MTTATVLFPDAAALLLDLKRQGIKTAIVSTKNRELIDEFLVANQLEYTVDLVLGVYDVPAPKPSPDGIMQAAARLEVALDDVLYVGDNLIDARTAVNAGVDFGAVITGTTPAGAFATLPHKAILPCLAGLRSVVWGG